MSTCHICSKQHELHDITEYKTRAICRTCVYFLRHTILFYPPMPDLVRTKRCYDLPGLDGSDETTDEDV
jgi:hypothetical protein